MHQLLQTIFDFILPPKDDVRRAQSITEEELHALLRPTVVHEAWILALFPYKDARVRAIIRSVKFYADTAALPKIGRITAEFLLETISDKKLFSAWDVPLLVPMPASKKRLRERGYNQVERFAESILESLSDSVTYAPDILKRGERESQVRIKRGARGDNIKGAFFVSRPELVHGKHVILLDDVVESGATIKDARRALLKAGAAEVLGIAIAH